MYQILVFLISLALIPKVFGLGLALLNNVFNVITAGLSRNNKNNPNIQE